MRCIFLHKRGGRLGGDGVLSQTASRGDQSETERLLTPDPRDGGGLADEYVCWGAKASPIPAFLSTVVKLSGSQCVLIQEQPNWTHDSWW